MEMGNMTSQDFISYLKTLKPEDWTKQATSKWTVKDVVAHLVGWERKDPQEIRKAWETKELPWWETTSDFDEFNRESVEHYKSASPLQLIEEWMRWSEKVQREVKRIGEENLRQYPHLFRWLFEGEGSKGSKHNKHHYDQIRRAVEESSR